MKPPKFTIGESLYLSHCLYTPYFVKDRYWDSDEDCWRYKIGHHPTWFFEAALRSELEVQEIFAEEPVADDEDDDEDFEDCDYEYDGDTGRALVNGQWQIVDSDQWDRFQRS